MSKSQLDKKLKAKMQIILFLFFFNFGRKNHENLWLVNANFLTTFGHFLTKNISQEWDLSSHIEIDCLFHFKMEYSITSSYMIQKGGEKVYDKVF